MNETIVIDKRFRGPPDSGNGGYSCGRLARLIGDRATVRLMAPPPLETPLEVRRDEKHLFLMDGDKTVARAAAHDGLGLSIPPLPERAELLRAADRFRGHTEHFYPTCFVCGPARETGDGLRLFAGPIDDNSAAAALWQPGADLSDENGLVRSEFLWAALDCPGAYSFAAPETGAILLGELSAEILEPVPAGKPVSVLAWEIDSSGRKHRTGTALFNEEGKLLAQAVGIWIEIS